MLLKKKWMWSQQRKPLKLFDVKFLMYETRFSNIQYALAKKGSV